MAVQLLPIDKFPLEIIRRIISSPELSTKDLRNCRLTCILFKEPAEERLFRSVCISLLTSDLFRFTAISLFPHLAVLVRELVWLEHPGFKAEEVKEWVDNYEPPISADLRTRILQSFWRYDISKFNISVEPKNGPKENISGNLRTIFSHYLERMPRITTFVSQNMDHRRSTGGESDEDISIFHAPCVPGVSNEGFVKFLMPALERRESSVRSLVWEEESGYTLAETFSPVAFTGLTSIDIRFRRLPHWENLVDCLRTASGLLQLSLTSMGDHEPHVFGRIRRSPRWEYLTVVRFNKIKVSDEDLIYFVECHGTLYHLRVIGWSLRVETKQNVEGILRRAKLEFDANDVDGEDQSQS